MRGDAKYWLVLALVLSAAVAFETLRPRPLDWTPTLLPGDTRPYGAEALYRLLPGLVGGEVRVESAPLLDLFETLDTAETLLLMDVQMRLSDFEVRELLAFVEGGGTVVLAAHELPPAMDDTLGLDTFSNPLARLLPTSEKVDTLTVEFVAPGLDGPLRVVEALAPAEADLLDPDSTRWAVPRQTLATDGPGSVLAVRYPVGSGALVFTHAPLLLSNYGFVNSEGAAFAEKLFAYVPEGDVVWWRRGFAEAQTPLRYVLRQDGLRRAFYTALFGVLLFMLMAARRRERPVPTVAPPRNATVDFVRTIGMLYYNRGDHANLAAKLRAQFHAYARDVLNLSMPPDAPDFALHVAQRSGVAREQVDALLAHLDRSEKQQNTYSRDLLDLSHDLQAFYRASTRTSRQPA